MSQAHNLFTMSQAHNLFTMSQTHDLQIFGVSPKSLTKGITLRICRLRITLRICRLRFLVTHLFTVLSFVRVLVCCLQDVLEMCDQEVSVPMQWAALRHLCLRCDNLTELDGSLVSLYCFDHYSHHW